ncbi:MAG: Sec-independent protein translocase subunit TatB [Campylobacteraceae bacterium]|nr:Sec-independent protein translocase subunit TatB [Campylobacteraceae bacterium]
MFGISFPEMLVIAIVAVIALGPEKLPQAMVDIARFMKLFKKTINDAKSGFEQELRIAELKEDAKKYKESIEKTKTDVRKKLTFDELEEIKSGVNETKDALNLSLGDIKKGAEALKNPSATIKNEIKDAVFKDDKAEKSSPADENKNEDDKGVDNV